jgi:hypothetical protein
MHDEEVKEADQARKHRVCVHCAMGVGHRNKERVGKVVVELELDRAKVGVAGCVPFKGTLEDIVG